MLHKGKLKKREEDISSHGSPSTFTIKNKLHSKSTYFYRWTYIVPSVCSLALVLILGITIFPSVNALDAHATDSVLQASGNSSISLTLGGAAEQVTTATADTVSYRTNTFTVSYSLAHQYEVFVHSMNGYTGELVGAQNPTAKIGGVGTDVATSNFGNNTWGYAVKEGTETEVKKEDLLYSSIPAYGNEGKAIVTATTENGQITENEGEKTYTLAFAAKIGSDSPADHYQTKVYLSVVNQPGRIYTVTYNLNGGEWDGEDVESQIDKELGDNFNFQLPSAGASPKWVKHKFLGWSTTQHSVYDKTDKTAAELAATYKAGGVLDFTTDMSADLTLYAVWMVAPGLSGIDTMQEMTAEVCSDENTTVGETKRLRDVRDDKYYWVAKLADGNCWMTQNLDFDIPEDGVMDPTLSNLPNDFTKIDGVVNRYADSTVGWSSTSSDGMRDYNKINYYDPGLFVKNNPNTSNKCGENNGSDKLTSFLAQSCVNAGWAGVGNGYTARVTAPQTDSPSITSNNVLDGMTYDAHYLVGNYYSWAAATAGYSNQEGLVAGGHVQYSVCPKGWRLPLTGEQNNDVAGSFYKLYSSYGFANGGSSGTSNGYTYNIYDAPLYLLRPGFVLDSGASTDYTGYIRDSGQANRYWSAIVQDNSVAGALSGDGILYLNSTENRQYGLPVRCVNDSSVVE